MARYFENKLVNDPERSKLLTKDDNGSTVQWSVSEAFARQLGSKIESMLKCLEERIPSSNSNDSISVYTGRGGFAYLYLHLALSNPDKASEYMTKARDMVTPCLRRLRGRRISFLNGDPGPLAIALALNHLQNRNQPQNCDLLTQLDEVCQMTLDHPKRHPHELLYGSAGLLYSLLFVKKHCDPGIITDGQIKSIVEHIYNSGMQYSRRNRSRFPLMFEWHEKEYIGPAHGVSGILHILLQAKDFLSNDQLKHVRNSIDTLADLQFLSGNFPSSMGNDRDRLVQWCHGAAGVIHLYIRAYETFDRDPRYLSVAKRCGNVVWERGLLRKGYGLCHGTAGNGYAFLGLHRITGEVAWLQKALAFAEWCCDHGKHGCEVPDEPECFINGLAGTITFLHDVRRGNSHFPCLDV